jgi:hypothetical protein
MSKIINYFGSEKRFYIILAVLFIMWLGIMTLFYLKADEVTKSPCSICANKLNENVVCSINNGEIRQRVYYPNFTILDR